MEAQQAQWSSPQDIKSLYRSADIIAGNRVIFNIAGNEYCLIVHINYYLQIIFIRFIGTHAQYDIINAEKI